MPISPALSFSTVSFCDAIIGAACLASVSKPICFDSAILASWSNLSASVALARGAECVGLL